MPIPELEMARVKRLLDKFCDRIPLHIRPQLSNLYRVRGNSVVLIERRSYFLDRRRHTEHQFAKFVYSPTMGAWSLRWRDRNGKWHPYDGFEKVPHFRNALAEVASDPTGIFLG